MFLLEGSDKSDLDGFLPAELEKDVKENLIRCFYKVSNFNVVYLLILSLFNYKLTIVLF